MTTAPAISTFSSTATASVHNSFPRDAGFSGRDAKNDLMFAATLSLMLAACTLWPIAGAGEVQTLLTPRAAATSPAPVAVARLDTVVIHRSKPAAASVLAAAATPLVAPLVPDTRHALAPSGGKAL